MNLRISQGRHVDLAGTAADRLEHAFVLPVAGLFADMEAGAGAVRLTDNFTDSQAARQLAVLEGWEQGLANARARAYVKLYREVCAECSGLAAPEQAERFKQACVALGIECPPIAVLLQQQPDAEFGGQAALTPHAATSRAWPTGSAR